MLLYLNPLSFISLVTSSERFGGISKYNSKRENWSNYFERIELFFTANDITDETRMKEMLHNCCGINRLTDPVKPGEKSFIELVIVIKYHQNLKRNSVAERFIFKTRSRKPEENISNYMAELRRSSQNYNYEGSLEKNTSLDTTLSLKSTIWWEQRLYNTWVKKKLTIWLHLKWADKENFHFSVM